MTLKKFTADITKAEHQKRHQRESKTGLVFSAGRGIERPGKFEVLVVQRASYGKPDTPIQDREYSNRQLGTAVGTRKDWFEIARQHNYDAVEFIELDGSKELRTIADVWEEGFYPK
jgi:hypothetical protein